MSGKHCPRCDMGTPPRPCPGVECGREAEIARLRARVEALERAGRDVLNLIEQRDSPIKNADSVRKFRAALDAGKKDPDCECRAVDVGLPIQWANRLNNIHALLAREIRAAAAGPEVGTGHCGGCPGYYYVSTDPSEDSDVPCLGIATPSLEAPIGLQEAFEAVVADFKAYKESHPPSREAVLALCKAADRALDGAHFFYQHGGVAAACKAEFCEGVRDALQRVREEMGT